MSRILTIALIISLATCGLAQTNYQTANKASANFQSFGIYLPWSIYTSTICWLNADCPPYNAGTTNHTYVDFSYRGTTNWVQPVVSKQPLRVLTNGVYAWVSDVDDFIVNNGDNVNLNSAYLGVDPTNKWTIATWFKVDDIGDTKVLYISSSLENHGVASTPEIFFDTGSYEGSTPMIYQIETSLGLNDNTWHEVAWTWDGAVSKLWIDGAYDRDIYITGLAVVPDDDTVIAGMNQVMSEFIICDRALTTNEIASLYHVTNRGRR